MLARWIYLRPSYMWKTTLRCSPLPPSLLRRPQCSCHRWVHQALSRPSQEETGAEGHVETDPAHGESGRKSVCSCLRQPVGGIVFYSRR